MLVPYFVIGFNLLNERILYYKIMHMKIFSKYVYILFLFYKLFDFRTLASSGKEFKDPFLKAVGQREEANRSGKNDSKYNATKFSNKLIHLFLL